MAKKKKVNQKEFIEIIKEAFGKDYGYDNVLNEISIAFDKWHEDWYGHQHKSSSMSHRSKVIFEELKKRGVYDKENVGL